MVTKKKSLDAQRKAYIRKHPNLSRTIIYKRWKGTKLGIRKTTALRLVRSVRGKRPPTRKKRLVSVPKKFRKPGAPVPSEKPPASEYTIARVKDRTGNEYYIKYIGRDELNRQLRILGSLYQIEDDTLEVLETKPYTEFVADEFKI